VVSSHSRATLRIAETKSKCIWNSAALYDQGPQDEQRHDGHDRNHD